MNRDKFITIFRCMDNLKIVDVMKNFEAELEFQYDAENESYSSTLFGKDFLWARQSDLDYDEDEEQEFKDSVIILFNENKLAFSVMFLAGLCDNIDINELDFDKIYDILKNDFGINFNIINKANIKELDEFIKAGHSIKEYSDMFSHEIVVKSIDKIAKTFEKTDPVRIAHMIANFESALSTNWRDKSGGYDFFEYDIHGGKRELRLFGKVILTEEAQSNITPKQADDLYDKFLNGGLKSSTYNIEKDNEFKENAIKYVTDHKLALSTIYIADINCDNIKIEDLKFLVNAVEDMLEKRFGISITAMEFIDNKKLMSLAYCGISLKDISDIELKEWDKESR